MKKYKIAYTVPSSRIAGTERSLLLLLNNINKDLFDNIVVCFESGPFTDLLQQEGHKVTIIKRKNRKSLLAFYKLYRFFKQNKINMLYESSSRVDALSAKLLRIPVVERQNMTRDSGQWFINRIKFSDRLSSLLVVDKILAVSNAIRDKLIKRGINSHKITTIYNGVSIEKYRVTINNKKKIKELGLQKNKPVVTVIGRLSKQKGHVFFLNALPEIIRNYPDVQFLIVGEGSLKNKLIKMSKELEVEKSVIYSGFRTDIPEIYAISDIIVLPSLWEPLANVALESMAAKKPIIATNVDGMSEAIINNQTGMLVPPADSQALSNAIIDLLINKNKAKQLALAGHEHVIKNFSIQQMVNETEKLFLSCLENKSKINDF